jgi:hypothetical protein
LARQQKYDIVRHQTQNRFDVAGLGRGDPGRDELTYFLFITVHGSS